VQQFELTFIPFPPIQIELGTACGKLFRCSTMAVLDAGDSDILSEQTQ
jgi:large subunit ribosomal protein L30e